ncbi:MAG: hypothetical protein IT167_11500 [Bryobacterales bacterium]|nr:hypothetical protein [Bryobacterales bacterium]
MAEPLAVETGSPAHLRDFAGWVLAEQKRIFLLCHRLLQDREDADSATQDVFLKAHKALQNPSTPIDDPARWLTRIAVNTCLDRLRSRRWQFWKKRPHPSNEGLILTMAASAAPNAEEQVFARLPLLLKWAPAAATLAMVLVAALWKTPATPPPSRTDAQLMTEIYQTVYTSEPAAFQPVHGLFAENKKATHAAQ